MRVPGVQGPSRLCSFADRDETPGSPASISSATYGWEKQNCSNGTSWVEGLRAGWWGTGGAPGTTLPAAESWRLCPGHMG